MANPLDQLDTFDQVRATNIVADQAAMYAIDPVRYLAEGPLTSTLKRDYGIPLLSQVADDLLTEHPDWLRRSIGVRRAVIREREEAAAKAVEEAKAAIENGDRGRAAERLREAANLNPDFIVIRTATVERVLARLA